VTKKKDVIALCGAKTRPGARHPTCVHTAGWGTDHPGEGRCKLHGGLSPVKHGRYSTVRREPLRQLIEQYEAEPDPLNVLPEIALARAALVDFVNRYDETTDALLAWHASYERAHIPLAEDKKLALLGVLDKYEAGAGDRGDELTAKQRESLELARGAVAFLATAQAGGKPHKVLDVADVHRMASEVTKMVERVEKTRAANAIGRADLARIMSEMGRVVDTHVGLAVTDAAAAKALKAKIAEGWLGIRV
jgi:hypothetical protein